MAQEASTTPQQEDQKQEEPAKKGLFGSLKDKATKVAHDVGTVAKDV
eukprot:CAMPEP_0197024638 /NCGR_PEP_ID=MMETSP1384-20130603/5146_1 /TAXON_ID=29189 /ORGANISM="Ammonia sp." /LENGTH=46 /DNA_ID= /DNA_START= /DNA_END= /DNA_ORIENTATION=